METPNVIGVLILFGAVLIPAKGAATTEKTLPDFTNAIWCANPDVDNARYSSYGCFCGFGRNGNNPVDGIDRCCQDHDVCYSEAANMGCYLWFTVYTSTCENQMPLCEKSSYPCSNKMCECDVAAALCFKKYSSNFDKYFIRFDQTQCKTT